MKPVVVLAMHGAPPNDMPREEISEYFGLRARLGRGPGGPERAALERRYVELEEKVRDWPRTAQNDRFHAAAFDVALHLQEAAGMSVIVGFNEFCRPTLDEALDQAAAGSPDRVLVITPMMTRGGEHTESEIPAAIRRALERHPGLVVEYVWPFETAEVARFLAEQLGKRIANSE